MPRRRWFHPRDLLPRLSFVLLMGCLSDDVSYSPEKDDAAMETISQVFSDSSLTLSLCEDLSAPEPTHTCGVEHVVRGDGRGRRHEEEHGNVGCGGCLFSVVAYVTGTISGGTFASPTAITGEVSLGGGDMDDPYSYPFSVKVRCTEPGQTCLLYGTLHEDGRLDLSTSAIGDPIDFTLAPGGPATCP